MDQDIIEVRNYRLVTPKGPKIAGNQKHPLQPVQQGQELVEFQGELLQPTEDFSVVYVGEQIKAMAVIRCRGNILMGSDDAQRKQVRLLQFKEEGVKGGQEFKLKYACNIESEKSFKFNFVLKHKSKPFLNNQQTTAIIPEVQKVKQYMVTPQLPFLIEKSESLIQAPVFFFEYAVQTKLQTDLILKTVSFLPEDIFEATRINFDDKNQEELIILKPEEKEKIIFRIDVKPGMMSEYYDLIARNAGKLQIGQFLLEWGLCGIYMRNREEISIQCPEIELTFTETPRLVLKTISKCSILVSFFPLIQYRRVRIVLKENEMEGIKIVGLENTVIDLSRSQSGSRFELIVHVNPTALGIQLLKGIYFQDEDQKRPLSFKNSLHALVLNKDEDMEFFKPKNQQAFENNEDFMDFFGTGDAPVPQKQPSQPAGPLLIAPNDDMDDFFPYAPAQTNFNEKTTVKNAAAEQEELSIFDDFLSQPAASGLDLISGKASSSQYQQLDLL